MESKSGDHKAQMFVYCSLASVYANHMHSTTINKQKNTEWYTQDVDRLLIAALRIADNKKQLQKRINFRASCFCLELQQNLSVITKPLNVQHETINKLSFKKKCQLQYFKIFLTFSTAIENFFDIFQILLHVLHGVAGW